MRVLNIIFHISIFLFFIVLNIPNSYSKEVRQISRRESVKIAEQELLRQNLQYKIKRRRPKVYDSSEINYSNSKLDTFIYTAHVIGKDEKSIFDQAWFVLFKSKFFSVNSGFLVIIDKNNGEIKYSFLGNPIQSLVNSFLQDQLTEHQDYLKAIVQYHKDQSRWPENGEDLTESKVEKSKLKDLSFIHKDQNSVTVFVKNFDWSYDICFLKGDYQVSFNILSEQPQDVIEAIERKIKNSEDAYRIK